MMFLVLGPHFNLGFLLRSVAFGWILGSVLIGLRVHNFTVPLLLGFPGGSASNPL